MVVVCCGLPPAPFQPSSRGRPLRSAPAAASPPVPAAQTIRLTLRKPLGLVLAERPGPPAEVFIEEIAPGGNADKDGRLAVGDTLVGCSAVILKAGK